VDNYVNYDKSWKFTVEDFTDGINMFYIKTRLLAILTLVLWWWRVIEWWFVGFYMWATI